MMADQNKQELQLVAQELDSPFVYFCIADVSQTSEVVRSVQETLSRFSKIDVFLNNASIME
jgi:NADP-dependent 3-hydroxy acid dehydrogenase YdfG